MLAASSPLQGFATTFGGILAAIGLIFLLVGLVIRRASRGSRGFRGRAARATGTIVGFDSRVPGMVGSRRWFSVGPGTGGQMLYFPTVEFTMPDGTAVKATSHFGSNPRRGRVGDAVTVLYDPGDPQRIHIDSAGGAGSCLETGFILLGGALAALGIYVLIASH